MSLARFFLRREFSAPLTKLRVKRPLHHGSLAERAPLGPLPRFAGADGASARILATRIGARVVRRAIGNGSRAGKIRSHQTRNRLGPGKGQGWCPPFSLPLSFARSSFNK